MKVDLREVLERVSAWIQALDMMCNGHSKPVAISSYLIPHWEKIAFVKLGEVFTHVLIGQITAQENTMYRAVLVAKFIEGTGRFALLKKLVETCVD